MESEGYSVTNIEVNFSDSKLDRKNYFTSANYSYLTMDKEASEIFPNNENTIDVHSRNETLSDSDVIEKRTCNNNNSCVIELSVKNEKSGELSFGRKYKFSKNKELSNSVKTCGVKNNENVSGMKDRFNRKGELSKSTKKQMLKNKIETCSKKGISKVKKIENEKSLNDKRKRKLEIGDEVKSSSISSEIRPSCSTIVEKSNQITFGRKRKLSNENLSQENKKLRSI